MAIRLLLATHPLSLSEVKSVPRHALTLSLFLYFLFLF